jgi:hypothetical protein
MKLVRPLLILLAMIALTAMAGYSNLFVNSNQAGACARCGDGQCQRSCGENPLSCPKDCGGVPERE